MIDLRERLGGEVLHVGLPVKEKLQEDLLDIEKHGLDLFLGGAVEIDHLIEIDGAVALIVQRSFFTEYSFQKADTEIWKGFSIFVQLKYLRLILNLLLPMLFLEAPRYRRCLPLSSMPKAFHSSAISSPYQPSSLFPPGLTISLNHNR